MAHSIQLYRGKSRIFNDLDLMVVVAIVLDLVKSRPTDRELELLANRWHRALALYGPGCLDLELDDFAKSTLARDVLLDLLKEAENKAVVYGDRIPGDALNKLIDNSGIEFHDYPVSLVVKTIRSIQEMMTLSDLVKAETPDRAEKE